MKLTTSNTIQHWSAYAKNWTAWQIRERERERERNNGHNIYIYSSIFDRYRKHAQHARYEDIPSWSQSSSCPLQESGPWSPLVGIAIWVLLQELFQGHVFIGRMRRGVELNFRWSVQATSTMSLHQTGRTAETEWEELPALVDQARDGAASKIQNGSCEGKILTTKLYKTCPTWRRTWLAHLPLGHLRHEAILHPSLINLMAWHEGWCRKAPPWHCHTPWYNMMTVMNSRHTHGGTVCSCGDQSLYLTVPAPGPYMNSMKYA